MQRRLGTVLAVVMAALLAVGASASTASAGEVRLEFQGRVDALNVFGVDGSIRGGRLDDPFPMFSVVPIVTPGVRFLDGALYLGLGFGYSSSSYSICEDVSDGGCAERETITDWTSWSLSPMVNYEFLSGDAGGLYFLGWLNLGELLDRTIEDIRRNGQRVISDDGGDFWWGLNVGLGIRGELSKAVSLGVEFGWGMAMGSSNEPDREDGAFGHGIWGTLNLSVGIPL